MIACKFSFAPFGDPGNVTMMERFRTPATGRAMIAKGVTARDEAIMP